MKLTQDMLHQIGRNNATSFFNSYAKKYVVDKEKKTVTFFYQTCNVVMSFDLIKKNVLELGLA